MFFFYAIAITFVSFLLIFIGWKLSAFYKKVIFYFVKKKAKKSEKKAKILLKKNNYRIIKEQYVQNHNLYDNDEKKSFTIRPDFIVEKKGFLYIAEVKSGSYSHINNIHTRRQLLEYSFYNKDKTVLLIDTENETIRKIEFFYSNYT